MRFYKMTNGSWETDRIRAGKGAVLEEVPTGSKPDMLKWLNNHIVIEGMQVDPPVMAADVETTRSPHYSSPFSAATTIQKIDATMCAQALKQMDGPAAAIIVAALIERLKELKDG